MRSETASASTEVSGNIHDWLDCASPDAVFEGTSLDIETGMPAVDHIREILEFGAHAITANKGPALHAYAELSALAQKKGREFLFESTVMDGIPIFSLFRETLPDIRVKGFRGILNSTTNWILDALERGVTFDHALQEAHQLGIAEENADLDIDGWDATIKTALLIRVIMQTDIRLDDIDRQGIRQLSVEALQPARKAGRPYKLICQALRVGASIKASVREQLSMTDPLALLTGASSAICFETDFFTDIMITEKDPGLDATAYGMYSDFVRAVDPAWHSLVSTRAICVEGGAN